VRDADPAALGKQNWPFADERLPELLFRYRARNFPQTLTNQEQQQWQLFCQQRLLQAELGAPITLAGFYQGLDQAGDELSPAQQQLLDDWRAYATALQQRIGMDI
jgi:exodeoxyribonuclease-1